MLLQGPRYADRFKPGSHQRRPFRSSTQAPGGLGQSLCPGTLAPPAGLDPGSARTSSRDVAVVTSIFLSCAIAAPILVNIGVLTLTFRHRSARLPQYRGYPRPGPEGSAIHHPSASRADLRRACFPRIMYGITFLTIARFAALLSRSLSAPSRIIGRLHNPEGSSTAVIAGSSTQRCPPGPP